MATAKEMRDLTVDELKKRVTELREGLFNMKVKHRTGSLDAPSDLGKNRKDLARLLTILTEKENAAKPPRAAKPADKATAKRA